MNWTYQDLGRSKRARLKHQLREELPVDSRSLGRFEVATADRNIDIRLRPQHRVGELQPMRPWLRLRVAKSTQLRVDMPFIERLVVEGCVDLQDSDWQFLVDKRSLQVLVELEWVHAPGSSESGHFVCEYSSE